MPTHHVHFRKELQQVDTRAMRLQRLWPLNADLCVHTHAHQHTHTNEHTRAHILTRSHTRTRTHARTHTHTHTHAHTHTHTHTSSAHTGCKCERICGRVYTHARTHTHTRTHTRTHTHTHTHNTHVCIDVEGLVRMGSKCKQRRSRSGRSGAALPIFQRRCLTSQT